MPTSTTTSNTLSLSDILAAIADMEFASDESIERFATHLKKHGINEETLMLFQALLDEEIRGRDEEIETVKSSLSQIDEKLATIEPQVQEEEQKLDEQIDAQCTEIEHDAERFYNGLAQFVFEESGKKQTKTDEEKIKALKKAAGI